MALWSLEGTHCESQQSHMDLSPERAFHLSWQMQHKYSQSIWKQVKDYSPVMEM